MSAFSDDARFAGGSVFQCYSLVVQPAKQVEAYSLGWSEALRAQP